MPSAQATASSQGMQLDKTINVLGICIKRLTSFARHDAPYPDENVVGFAEPRSSVTGALARGDDADGRQFADLE
jgi:hypothetical protein